MMDNCQRAYYALRHLDEAGYLLEAVGEYSGLTPELEQVISSLSNSYMRLSKIHEELKDAEYGEVES